MWKAGCFYLHGLRWYTPDADKIGRWIFVEEVVKEVEEEIPEEIKEESK